VGELTVHDLNCGTLRPFGSPSLVCRCLLIETAGGLVLVDTGFGPADIERLRRPRPPAMQLARYAYAKLVIRAALDPAETASAQLGRLGHSPADVTDIVLTHLDLDHAGGLADFPNARVHVDAAEHDFADPPQGRGVHRFRYWDYQWEHGPDWVTYPPGGEPWLGLDGARDLHGLPGMKLVPLPGHSRGHCGVAIDTGDGRWLLHAADAYFHHREIDPDRPRSIAGLSAFQKQFEYDAAARHDTQQRLRELLRAHGGTVEIICSHDPRQAR
jgi:glyoxylase-like metal-dependent hydrolase (beta-lactamase superfamily II)